MCNLTPCQGPCWYQWDCSPAPGFVGLNPNIAVKKKKKQSWPLHVEWLDMTNLTSPECNPEPWVRHRVHYTDNEEAKYLGMVSRRPI